MTDTSLSNGLQIEARHFASLGKRDHGWLKPNFHFSFSDYYDPARMNWGAIRVWNDDEIAAQSGFAPHAHDNMEIISIPLSGDLEHKDSLGTTAVISTGDIQVMSAGSGIMHSEYNKNKDREVCFLQIWVIPNQMNVTPRYDQITIDQEKSKNTLQQILSPNKEDAGVWIHQDAWFHLGNFTKDSEFTYTLKKEGNGLYVFLLSGTLIVDTYTLSARDGIGITAFEQLNFKAGSDLSVLLMEVPMLKL